MTTAISSPSASTVRQLELTINALARSMRKAIRTAEREDPLGEAGSSAAWQQATQRQAMLMQLMAAAAAFLCAFSQAPVPEAQPVTAPETEVPAGQVNLVAETAEAEVAVGPVVSTSLMDYPLVKAINELPGELERPQDVLIQLSRIASLKRVRASSTGMRKAQEKYIAAQLDTLRQLAQAWSQECPHLGLAAKLGIAPA